MQSLRLFLLLLLSLSFTTSLSSQIAFAEEWLQADYVTQVGMDLSEDQQEKIREIQSEFRQLQAERPPLDQLLGSERDRYIEALEGFFSAITDEMNEEQQGDFNGFWHVRQRLRLQESLEADYPGIGISYEQANRLARAISDEEVTLLESLPAERLRSLLFPRQIALFDTFNSVQEQGLQALQLQKQLATQQRERNAEMEVIHTTVLNYLVPLRELRSQLERELSAEDRRLIASLRAERRKLSDPEIETQQAEARSVENLALYIEPVCYIFHHFPRDFRDEMPMAEFGEGEIDTIAIAELVERKRSLFEAYEGPIFDITQRTRSELRALGSFHVTGEVSRELEEVLFFPKDSLSNRFKEIFLLMEPINLDRPETGYPNPFLGNPLPTAMADTATVSIALHAARDIKLEVIRELDGEVVIPIVEHTYTPGDYQFEVDVSDLPEGRYAYFLETNNGGRYLWPLVIER